MTSYSVRPPQRKKNKALLPVMGIALAVLLGVIAYVVAPMLLEFAEEQDAGLKQQFDDLRANEDLPEKTLDWIATGLLWLVMLGLSMFFASALIGKDPEKGSLKQMSASPANKKAMIKQMQRDLKIAKKRQKELQRQKKK